MKNRGGGGVICHNLTEKTGMLAGIIAVEDDDDVMMITDSGIIIRTPASGVSIYSRTASGVIMMRLDGEQKIVNVTKTAKEEEKPKDELAEGAEPDAESVEIAEAAEGEAVDAVTEASEDAAEEAEADFEAEGEESEE
jgi:DNA gyrase subunit A